MAAATMVRAGTAIGTLRSCLMRFSRSDAERARRAYSTLIEIAADGDDASPHHHVEWLRRFDSEVAQIDGLAFCTRARLDEVLQAVGHQGRAYEGEGVRRDWDAFDPAEHVVVSCDLSLLSYLEEVDLGPGGHLVASHFKSAVAWWEGGSRGTRA